MGAQGLDDAQMTHPEEPLFGGLVSGRAVKVGATVRREAGPWTPTIQALLAHLTARGFPAPAPLGTDEQGREVVSWIEGVAAHRPWPEALASAEGPAAIGAFARAYGEAVEDFRPPRPAIWRHGREDPAPGQVVLHGDFAPHNVIWRDGGVAGLIDFELARPGRTIEDAAYLVIRVAHLRPDDMGPPVPGWRPDRRARLHAFANAYGCAAETLVAEILPAQRGELARILTLGGSGLQPWATFLRLGLADQVREELAWQEANIGALL